MRDVKEMTESTYLAELADKIDEMDAFEKKFVLWRLLEWHKERLDKAVNGRPDPETAKDAYELQMMTNHKKIADEMCYVLIAELF